MTRPLAELIDAQEPAIALVEEWLAGATNAVERLPCARADGERALLALQVTTRSPLGALAYETGGLLVDHGWLRVLGAGSPRLPRSIDGWNRIATAQPSHRLPGALLVGDDVLGGFFALNGGAFGARPRPTVWYLPPDTLEWEEGELGYTEWLRWTLTGDLEQYYDGLRWPGWHDDVQALPGDRGLAVAPLLLVKEGGPIAERRRAPVPLEEQWGLHACDLPRQLGLPHVASSD